MVEIQRRVAIYKALIDTDINTDILDPFQRIVEAAIYSDVKSTFSINDLSLLLKDKWVVEIPEMPLRTIVGRIVGKKAIERIKTDRNRFGVKNRELLKETATNINMQKNKIESDFDFLIDDFIEYTLRTSEVKLESIDAGKVIEAFVSEHATNISLERNKVSESTNIYFASYFLDKCLDDKRLSDILKTITFGYILSESIFITSPNETPRFGNMMVILDTPILFRLLGVNEIDEVSIYSDFVKLLQQSKAKVCTYNHCVEEMEKIIDNSCYWIENGDFDYSRASDTSIYFINKGCSRADIEECRHLIRQNIIDMDIEILHETYEKQSHPFVQDENRIYKTILEVYKEGNVYFKEDEKKDTIITDAESINKTYILRRGDKPINFANCNTIFVTNNYGLVFASKKFNDEIYFPNRNLLPTCVMDVILGTYLWIDNPMNVKELALKQMISQAYSIMTPSPQLWERYIEELTKNHERKVTTPEQDHMMRTSSFVSRALVRITMKDLKNVSYDTPMQIFEQVKELGKNEIMEEYQRREERLVEQTSTTINTLSSDLTTKDMELKSKVEMLKTLANRKVKRYTFYLNLLLSIIFTFVYLFLFYVFLDFATWKFDKQGLIYIGLLTIFIFFFFKFKIKNEQDPYGSCYSSIIKRIKNEINKEYLS